MVQQNTGKTPQCLKIVFWNNGIKGYCIISKCWGRGDKFSEGKQIMQIKCSSL